MNRRRWTFVAAMLAAAGVWLVVLSGSRAGKQPAVTASPPADEPVVAASEPSPRPIAVPAAPAAPAPEQPAPAPAKQKKEDDPNRPFALMMGETEADRAARARERSELDERWKKEARDAAWANESGGRITQLLTEESLSPAALRAVDCRQSICRFDLASSSGTDKEVMGLIHAARRLHLETWLHPEAQDDGTWRMQVFFPKEGYRLSGGGGRIDEPMQVRDAPDLQVTKGDSKVEG